MQKGERQLRKFLFTSNSPEDLTGDMQKCFNRGQ